MNTSINISAGRDNLIQLAEALLEPLSVTASIWATSFYFEQALLPQYFILSMLLFSVTFPGTPRLHEKWRGSLVDIILSWLIMVSLLVFLGYGTRSLSLFAREALLTLLWLPPVLQCTMHLLLRLALQKLHRLKGIKRRAIIVGLNEQGMQLGERMLTDPYSNIELLGYFDDRSCSRTQYPAGKPTLGKLSEIARGVGEHGVHLIYLSLPMASQPRILSILDDLRDTTASIYFVPDLFVTDIIQGHIDHVCGMPVVSVCDTPFTGSNGLIKRASDIALSLVILALVSPLLLMIALAVKLSSPGPVIFRQRRYGLDGKEIVVYKFRSMSVMEDGDSIRQATKGDQRVTPVGHFLRKTSLDELPQFFNVLQGRMSIVGPRPHAVAHNELYRGLIKGYMVRHKVKPGITGWAQVNGLRGETDVLEKMQARIEYDLDYLRHWSLHFDLKIILMTIGMVFKDQYAY